MSEWRDIASAPRDGTPLLLYCHGGIDIDPFYRPKGMSSDIVVGLWEVDADCPDGGRWSSDVGDIGEQLSPPINPTHWMPLPSPPETDNG